MPHLPADTDDTIRRALAEDLGRTGDVTSSAVIDEGAGCFAEIVTRERGVVAGLPVVGRVFALVDPGIEARLPRTDGTEVRPADVLGGVRGPARSILAAERVALNFLTHLSGIATLTRAFADACAGTESRILCTRKTLPGLRGLERYAVECGGGRLHRSGLDDGILIKDNHVALAGGVSAAVRRARERAPHTLRVEVEVDGLDQLQEALDAGADVILLDNAGADVVKRAVELVDRRVPLEVSGGMTVERVREIAHLAPLLISVGRLTHSAPALDIGLDIRPT